MLHDSISPSMISKPAFEYPAKLPDLLCMKTEKTPGDSESSSNDRQRKIFSALHFSYEWIRRSTFDSWKINYINKDDLAKAGFVYLRKGDLVQCYFCKGIVGFWECGDSPYPEHQKHFPNCPFVRGDLTSNIPLTSGGEDEGRVYVLLNNYLQRSLQSGMTSLPGSRLQVDSIPHGEQKMDRLAYPSFTSEKKRLLSFGNWPDSNLPQACKMAEAGFFYTGISDFVQCFSCGGGLFNWTECDDPLEDHRRYYSHCNFAADPKTLSIENSRKKRQVLTEEEAELLSQYPISLKLSDMGLSSSSIKGALKDYLELRSHLPGTFMNCVDAVMEWEERQKRSLSIDTLDEVQRGPKFPKFEENEILIENQA